MQYTSFTSHFNFSHPKNILPDLVLYLSMLRPKVEDPWHRLLETSFLKITNTLNKQTLQHYSSLPRYIGFLICGISNIIVETYWMACPLNHGQRNSFSTSCAPSSQHLPTSRRNFMTFLHVKLVNIFQKRNVSDITCGTPCMQTLWPSLMGVLYACANFITQN